MAAADRYDIAQYAIHGLFLLVSIVCYTWEIWFRTPWKSVRKGLLTFPPAVLHFCSSIFVCSKQRDIRTSLTHQEQSETLARVDKGTPAAIGVDQASIDQLESARVEKIDDESHRGRKAIPRVITWIPGLLWLISIVVPLLHLYRSSDTGKSQLLTHLTPGWNPSDRNVNADIGGIGIRVGLYMPVGLALLTLAFGVLHREDSGAKEIGNAQLLTLFYLNFNAVKAATARFRTLTFPEVMIACMCIDFTSAGLHMTTSGKETLAARWFVGVAAANQLVAASVVTAMLARIRHNYQGLPAAYAVWWGRIDSEKGPSKSTWTYIGVRWAIMLHGLWLDWSHSSTFHIIEKDWASLAPADQTSERLKEKSSAGAADNEPVSAGQRPKYVCPYQYATLPATAFSKWIEWLPSILVAIISLETLDKRLKNDSDIREWGQSAALVLAVAGVTHWCYVSAQIIREKQGQHCFFHWLWLTGVKAMQDALTIMRTPGTSDEPARHAVNFPRYANDWDGGMVDPNGTMLKAASSGDLKTVRHALRNGAEINYVNGKMTALLHTVAHGNVDFLGELQRRGAKLDVLTAHHAYAFASEQGRRECLAAFLQTDPNLPLYSNSESASPLWLAARHGKHQAVRLLVDACLRKWERGKVTIDALQHEDKGQRTPIYAAAEAGQLGAVQMMTEMSSQENLDFGCKAAILKAASLQNKGALVCFLKCDLDAIHLNENHDSLLHLVIYDLLSYPDAEWGLQTILIDRLRWLLELFKMCSRTIDARDRSGQTALFVASASPTAKLGRVWAAIGLMRACGADLFARRYDGTSPLSVAVKEAEAAELDSSQVWSAKNIHEHPYLSELFPKDYTYKSLLELPRRHIVEGLSQEQEDKLKWLARHGLIRPMDSLHGEEKRGSTVLDCALNSPRSALLCALMESSQWPNVSSMLTSHLTASSNLSPKELSDALGRTRKRLQSKLQQRVCGWIGVLKAREKLRRGIQDRRSSRRG